MDLKKNINDLTSDSDKITQGESINIESLSKEELKEDISIMKSIFDKNKVAMEELAKY